MPNNVTELLLNDEKKDILIALGCDEKYINGRASAYELFCEWERVLPLIEGTAQFENYKKELSALGFELPNFSENSKSLSKKRWIEINKSNFFGTFEDDGKQIFDGKIYEYSEKKTIKNPLNLLKIVSKYTNNCQSFAELCDSVTREIINPESLEFNILFDLCKAEYKRPDRYSAEQIFNRLNSDEKLNSEELFAFYAQILIELLIKAKDKKIILHFSKSTPLECIDSFLAYLSFRDLFRGQVLIEVDNDTDMKLFFKTVKKLYPDVMIFPKINSSVSDPTPLYKIYPRAAFFVEK